MPVFTMENKCSHCGKTIRVKVDTRSYRDAEGALIDSGWRFILGDYILCPECSKEFDDLLARQVDEHREFVHGDIDDPRWLTKKINVQISAAMYKTDTDA